MRKKKLFDDIQYRDEIWLENEENFKETLFWHNEWHNNRWGENDGIESEYDKMMELDRKYDFNDYEHCPSFWHYVIERDIYGNEKRIYCCNLVEEFYNT